MIDLYTRNEIDNIAYQLLKSSRSLGVYPTPVDTIISEANLIVDQRIDLSKIDKTFLEKFADSNIAKIFGKLRGAILKKERTIYLDLSQIAPRLNFVKLHECGHDLLPWQREMFEALDDDHTMSPSVIERNEAEANYFASTVLFQGERFDKELLNLNLHLDSAMALASMFGGSKHAALRRYVERHPKRCSLLVLERAPEDGKKAIFKIKDYFQSPTFSEEFGTLSWPEKVGWNWPFVQDYQKKRRKVDGVYNFEIEGSDVAFTYNFFDNGYNGFILSYPSGEVQKTRTKIILTNLERLHGVTSTYAEK